LKVRRGGAKVVGMGAVLTREDLQRCFEQLRNRPLHESMMFCHPKELWWYELDFSFDWYRRVRAFKGYWQFRKMFNDYEVMVVLSSILEGRYH
jgi:hypothetical protein